MYQKRNVEGGYKRELKVDVIAAAIVPSCTPLSTRYNLDRVADMQQLSEHGNCLRYYLGFLQPCRYDQSVYESIWSYHGLLLLEMLKVPFRGPDLATPSQQRYVICIWVKIFSLFYSFMDSLHMLYPIKSGLSTQILF